jgi:hypothetical protein
LSLQKRDKKPSKELVSLIRQSAKALVKFAELWKNVQDKGYAEGFDEKELQEMVRPYLKQRLTTGQIKYLFDPDYYKAKSAIQYKESKYDIFTQVKAFSYKGPIDLFIEFLVEMEKSGKLKDKKFDVLTKLSPEDIPTEKLPQMIEQLNKDYPRATEEDIEEMKSVSPALHFNEKAMREFLNKKE